MSTAEQLTTLIQTMVHEAVEAKVPAAKHLPNGQRLLTTKEAANYLGLSVRTIQNMVANGELRAVASGRIVRLDIEDLDRWIENAKKQQQ